MKNVLVLVLVAGLVACAPEQASQLNSQVDTVQSAATKVNDHLYNAGVTASAAVGVIPATPQEAVQKITEVGTAVVEGSQTASQE